MKKLKIVKRDGNLITIKRDTFCSYFYEFKSYNPKFPFRKYMLQVSNNGRLSGFMQYDDMFDIKDKFKDNNIFIVVD